MVDLTGAFGLKEACNKLGEKEADVRKFIKAHPSLAPENFEGRWVCDEEWVRTVREAMTKIESGICLHCGKHAFSLTTTGPAPEPAAE